MARSCSWSTGYETGCDRRRMNSRGEHMRKPLWDEWAEKRRSTQASMRSHTILPLIPPVLACHAMISRSQVSMVNTTRALTSPHRVVRAKC